jgi:1-phosphofructokinase family hexose kinase
VVEEQSGAVTKINEPGFDFTAEMAHDLKSALSELDLANNWVVFAGRLNPGADADTYRELVDFAHERGARVAVDASGDELRIVAKSSRPELIKPNQHELAELVGRPLPTMEHIVSAAREVLTWGVKMVLCSLGADGAILITDSEVAHVEPVEPVVGVPVGAGDILLATFLAGGVNAKALSKAVAWSAASVPLEGTSIPTLEQVEAVQVRVTMTLDTHRTLVEVA